VSEIVCLIMESTPNGAARNHKWIWCLLRISDVEGLPLTLGILLTVDLVTDSDLKGEKVAVYDFGIVQPIVDL
jgi:hypothetical protein